MGPWWLTWHLCLYMCEKCEMPRLWHTDTRTHGQWESRAVFSLSWIRNNALVGSVRRQLTSIWWNRLICNLHPPFSSKPLNFWSAAIRGGCRKVVHRKKWDFHHSFTLDKTQAKCESYFSRTLEGKREAFEPQSNSIFCLCPSLLYQAQSSASILVAVINILMCLDDLLPFISHLWWQANVHLYLRS